MFERNCDHIQFFTLHRFLLQYSNGAISVHETKQKFLEGSLHPVNVLMCPHTTVTNLPKPRQKFSGKHHTELFCKFGIWLSSLQ